MTTRAKVEHVIIVSAHDGHARVDRGTVRDLSAELPVSFVSGAKALKHLGENKVDLVVCDWELADMSGCEFVKLLRENPATRETPVVMASLESSEHAVLDAVVAGCSGYLVRPYSMASLEEQSTRAMRSATLPKTVMDWARRMRASHGGVRRERARREERTPEAPKAVSCDDRGTTRPGGRVESKAWFDLGRGHLEAGRFVEAVEAFQNAVLVAHSYAEAYEGLGHAWRGKGDMSNFVVNMKRAIRLYAEQDRYFEVKGLYFEILKLGVSMKNPFLSRGIELWKDGLREDAMLAWRRALKLSPDDEQIVVTMARAHVELERKDQAVAMLEEALDRNPHYREVEDLYLELTDQRRPTPYEQWKDRLRERIDGLRSAVLKPLGGGEPAKVALTLSDSL